MNATPKYFVRVGAEVRGPYGTEQLRELAEAGVVTAVTEAAIAQTGPWATLDGHAERAAIFPARARLGFKAATTFATVNRRVAEEGAPAEVRQMIDAAVMPGKILKLSPLQAAMEPEVVKAVKTEVPPNEVEVMVREVREQEARFAEPPAPPPPWRPSGRLIVVASLAVAGNGAILALPMVYGGWDDFWSMLVVRGWLVIGNGGLAVLYFSLPKK